MRLVGDRIVDERRHPVLHVTSAVAAIAIARGGGASARDLGLEREAMPQGVAAGVATAAVVVTPMTLALRHPSTDWGVARVVGDREAARRTSVEALLRIPVNTALYEELIFRGALHALLFRAFGQRAAWWGTALAFGAWHLPEALAGTSTEDRSWSSALVDSVGAAIGTALAGVGLTALRERSGSLAAPVIVHAAVNGAAHATVFAGDSPASADRENPSSVAGE